VLSSDGAGILGPLWQCGPTQLGSIECGWYSSEVHPHLVASLAQPLIIKLKLHSYSGLTRGGCSRCAALWPTRVYGTHEQWKRAIIHKDFIVI